MNPLSAIQRRLLYATTTVLVLSGAYWALLHYLGFRPYLSEPFLMKIHGAAAMVVLFLLGGLMPAHVTLGWALRRNRSSGAGLLVLCGLLAISGYVLYYSGDDASRQLASYLHLVFGIALPLAFGAHLIPSSSRQPAFASASQLPLDQPELAPCTTPKKAALKP